MQLRCPSLHLATWCVAALASALTAAPRICAAEASAQRADGLTNNAGSIHQEITFASGCARVYQALTGAREFDAVTRLSDAVTLVSAPGAKATAITDEVGAPFTLFGGYITGRNLDLVRDQRLVQAWRTGSWSPGDYSIVRFVLQTQGARCRLVFDQLGFPINEGASLAYGWRVHYWEPLAEFLRQQ
jgi:activator of HSP90 ATPase